MSARELTVLGTANQAPTHATTTAEAREIFPDTVAAEDLMRVHVPAR